MSSWATTLNKRETAGQLLRYALVGVASNVAGYLLYLLLTSFGIAPKIAMSALYLVGATIGFFGNRRITFLHRGSIVDSGVKFLIAHAIGYLIDLILLMIFVDRFGFPHQLIQGIAVIIVAAYLFFAFRLVVFKTPAAAIGVNRP